MLCTCWLPDNRIALMIRGKLAGFFIKKCGKYFRLGRDVTLLNTFNMEIGDNVYIAKGGWYNALGGLIIEDEVVLAPYVVISTLQHTFKDFSIFKGGSTYSSVRIGKGSWIASHVSIKCGVTIGEGCLIASNSSVTKNTDRYCIYGGVPAEIIKTIENQTIQTYTKMDIINNMKNFNQ
jgi:acetyltransferase-like isoleucine patch superfamily enzyme